MDGNGKLEINKVPEGACKYCLEHDESRLAHMVVIKMKTGHIHVHGPFGDKALLYEMMTAIENEILKQRTKEISSVKKRKKTNVRSS